MKFFIIVVLTTLAVANAKDICAGCPEPLDFQDAKHILDASLVKLPSLGGPLYKSGKIHSATKQIVAGILYKMNADLTDAANKVVACDVEIEKVPWEKRTQITIQCPNQEKIVKEYN